MVSEEKRVLAAARPFIEAIASGDDAAAYAQLSSHAKTRMSLSQFVVAEDDETIAKYEAEAIHNPTSEDFSMLLKRTAIHFGKPQAVIGVSVMSVDPTVLAGKTEAMERALTIGQIPDSVPAEIRKGSVRAQLLVKLNPDQLREVADQQGRDKDEVEKDESFKPYCNLKAVLVEEGGSLKVGYFEFTPASMWD
jgi:hypothetical protein